MITSLGFHTFTIFLRLTYSQALSLYKDFQRCKEVRIRPIGKNEKKSLRFSKRIYGGIYQQKQRYYMVHKI